MYSEKVLEHYRNPRNVGEIPDADGRGICLNESCGDITMLWIKMKNGKIIDAKFKTQGCAASIASGSVLTDMTIGKSLQEAQKITRQDVASALGGLPEQKVDCSLLATDALKEAIYDYLMRKGLPISEELEENHASIQPRIEKLRAMGCIIR